jgi:hypothetical protein
MHIVEIRRRSAELSATMAQMRTWLDHHRIEPKLFELAFLSGREVRFGLQFRNRRDAASFASVFSVEALGGPGVGDELAA